MWSKANQTDVMGHRVYGKSALQNLLADILAASGEDRRRASARVGAVLSTAWRLHNYLIAAIA